jgi:hypothetical protein
MVIKALPTDDVLNCDETMSRLYPYNILTWVKTSTDDLSRYIDGDENGGAAVLTTKSAGGIKWLLCFLATGKIVRVETNQFATLEPHWPMRNPSSWQTNETFQGYLEYPYRVIPVSQ